jgi:hypothetical protein
MTDDEHESNRHRTERFKVTAKSCSTNSGAQESEDSSEFATQQRWQRCSADVQPHNGRKAKSFLVPEAYNLVTVPNTVY